MNDVCSAPEPPLADTLARKASARYLKYLFVYHERCNMCGSPVAGHKVLGKRLNRPQRWRPGNKVGIATTVLRCRKCGLVYANPQPIPERLEDHYGVPPEDYWHVEYFSVSPGYLAGQIATFKRLHRGGPAGPLRALDVGVGIGKAMVALANAGFDVYGVEPSEPFYRRATDRMSIEKNRIQLAPVEDAAFEPASFDFINFGAVLEHLFDPSAVLQKALGWLRQDGLIHVEVPSSAWLMSRLARLFYRVTGSDYVVNTCPMHPPYHLYEFGLGSFRENGEVNGYKVVYHEYYVCDSYMPRILRPVFDTVMRLTGTGMQLAVWLGKVR
jgi:SAM-dependent methyltransferase